MKNTEINEDRLLHQLQELKEIGAIGLKGEFEAEGLSFEQMAFFSSLAEKAQLPLTVKIGGCEAKSDLIMAKNLKATNFVAPMIESRFALKKFENLLDKTFQDPGKIRSFINLESEQGFLNLDSILEAKEPRIAGVVFGRGDYISSLNDKTVGVDSEFVYEKLERVSKKCHSLSLKFGIGGGVTHLSQEQLQNISYLDFFETRKIVFRVEILKNRKDVFRTIIEKALLFEICWLKVKAKKFQEDPEDTRIENLFKRMKEKY